MTIIVHKRKITLTKVAFMSLAYPFLGADVMAGMSRYGEIILQARASASPLVVAAMEQYTHATSFERDEVALFLDIIVADSSVDLTLEERDAIIAGWPGNA